MGKKIFKLILAGFVIVLIGNGVSLAAEPGITKDSIKIGLFAPLSGPFQSYGVEPWRAATMYYNEVNKKGGIHGRKIALAVEDDKAVGADLVAAVKKLVTKDEVFILNGGCNSSAVVSAQEYIERVNVPLVMLIASGDQMLYPPSKYIFGGISITQRGAGGSMIEFVTKYLNAKKIAWINHKDAYGTWNLESAEYQLKTGYSGVTLVAVERVDREMTDTTAVALKVRNVNPDVICIMTYDRPGALIVRSLYELGVKCPLVMSVNGAANLVNTAKAVGVKEAFQNFYYQDSIAYGADDRPGPEWARKMYRENYPDLAKLPEYPAPYMFMGLSSAQIVSKALEDSGPNPTREKFLKALENIRNFEACAAGPISFSPDKHAANHAAVYLKFDGEKGTRVPGSYRSIWEGK